MELNAMSREFGTIIVGAGPAGVGPLVSACRQDRLDELLDSRVLIVDSGDKFGVGAIGGYAIQSDTSADTLLESIEMGDPRVLDRVKSSAVAREVETYRGSSLPLALVGAFLQQLGLALRAVVDAHPGSAFYPRSTVREIRRSNEDEWIVSIDRNRMAIQEVIAHRVVTACGGIQHRDRALTSPIGDGYTLSGAGLADRVMTSNALLSKDGPQKARHFLQSKSRPTVTIIGGSHSAMSAAGTLIHLTGLSFDAGAITILHNRPFRIFYPSREEALRDGYTDFGPQDFCPITQRLYRLAGLRMESRTLARRILRIGDADPESRVRLIPLDRSQPLPRESRDAIENAGLIITAFGYRPATPAFFDAAGGPIALQSDDASAALPLVDTKCRVLDRAGNVLPNVYGVGLASGFRYTGALGGEPSFTGQTNGLWLYQNDIGDMLRRQMIQAPSKILERAEHV
jgi:hypothetical protein